MDNLAIWNAVSKTDPKHTKKVNQRGGFTAISAHYQVMCATEQFGPVGIGWGYENGAPLFYDSLVFVPVTIWHGARENSFGPLYGGAEWKTGNRLDSDAIKKAATDGLTKALSHLGFNADVFLGRFDDNKYVAEMAKEFAGTGGGAGQSLDAQVSPPAADKLQDAVSQPHKTQLKGPHKSKSALWKAVRAFDHELRGCGDVDQFEAFLGMAESKALLAQVQEEAPTLWHGDESLPEEFEPLGALIAKMRTDLEALASLPPIKGAEYANAA